MDQLGWAIAAQFFFGPIFSEPSPAKTLGHHANPLDWEKIDTSTPKSQPNPEP